MDLNQSSILLVVHLSRPGMSAWEEALEDGSVRLHVQTGE